MRVLMVTNKVKTYALGFRNVIDPLIELGHSVVWAADFSGFVSDLSTIPCPIEQISINTNPLKKTNIKAYKQLLEIMDKHKIEVVMCSTPIGGMLARLAAKKKKIRPVIYEVHGFLFFRGAPLINRTIYKLEEKLLARYTDVLITINEEDYQAATKLKLRSGKKPSFVHGAGINIGVSVSMDRAKKRQEIGVPEDSFVIVSAGELNKNKNTEVIVKSLKETKDMHYVACGVGPEKERLESLSQQLEVSDRFHLLGYRTDMPEIMACSDVFVMMSFREGLPRSIMEAMDIGLPCVGSDTRGIRDLIDDEGGFICGAKDSKAFAKAFNTLMENPELRKRMGEYNNKKVKMYSSEIVREELKRIFKEAIK